MIPEFVQKARMEAQIRSMYHEICPHDFICDYTSKIRIITGPRVEDGYISSEPSYRCRGCGMRLGFEEKQKYDQWKKALTTTPESVERKERE